MWTLQETEKNLMDESIFTVPAEWPTWLEAPGTRWWITRDGGPEFQVKEVAKIFFRKSGSWLRMRMQPAHGHPAGWFTDDAGAPLEYTRVRGKVEDYSFRRFTLADIERMLWSYYRHESEEITTWYRSLHRTGKRGDQRMDRYQQVMTDATYRLWTGLEIIKWIGRLYGIVPPPAVHTTGSTSEPEARPAD